jgi:hypothetical protein
MVTMGKEQVDNAANSESGPNIEFDGFGHIIRHFVVELRDDDVCFRTTPYNSAGYGVRRLAIDPN